MGFNKVIYVAEGKEQLWMTLPTEAEEKLHNINYNDFTPPCVDAPDSGCLAAAAVRRLAPYIRNYVLDVANTVKIAPHTTSRCPHSGCMSSLLSPGVPSNAPWCKVALRRTMRRRWGR